MNESRWPGYRLHLMLHQESNSCNIYEMLKTKGDAVSKSMSEIDQLKGKWYRLKTKHVMIRLYLV